MSNSVKATWLVDLDARRAQRAEAMGESSTVRLGGESFTFPAVGAWPVEIVDVLGKDGDLLAGLKLLLSEEDFPRFMAQRPTMGDISDLFEALGQRAGLGDAGNSQDSAPS